VATSVPVYILNSQHYSTNQSIAHCNMVFGAIGIAGEFPSFKRSENYTTNILGNSTNIWRLKNYLSSRHGADTSGPGWGSVGPKRRWPLVLRILPPKVTSYKSPRWLVATPHHHRPLRLLDTRGLSRNHHSITRNIDLSLDLCECQVVPQSKKSLPGKSSSGIVHTPARLKRTVRNPS
jgi:hypothetical protein